MNDFATISDSDSQFSLASFGIIFIINKIWGIVLLCNHGNQKDVQYRGTPSLKGIPTKDMPLLGPYIKCPIKVL